MNSTPYNITPHTQGDVHYHASRELPQHGVILLAVSQVCNGATELAQEYRYHSLIEIWEVRNPDQPYHLTTVYSANDDSPDGHFDYSTAARNALVKAEQLAEVFAEIPSEDPGRLIRTLVVEEFLSDLPEPLGQVVAEVFRVMIGGSDEASAFDDFVDTLDLDDLGE